MVNLFQHYLPRSLVLLALAEILILIMSVYAGMQVYAIIMMASDSISLSEHLFFALLFTGIMFAAILATGLYWHYHQNGFFGMLIRVLVSFLLGITALVGLFYIFPATDFPRAAFGIALQTGLIGVLCAHSIHYLLSDSETLKTRILVLGAGKAAAQLAALEPTGVKIVGYVPVPGQGECVSPQKLLTTDKSIFELTKEHQIQEIVVALDDRRQAMPIDNLLECKLNGVKIAYAANFIEQRLGKINLRSLNPSAIIFSKGFRIPLCKSYRKRLLDVGVSLLLLILMSPLMMLAILAILIESRGRGPILFTQVRVGQGGVPFRVFKFRTMCVDAEKAGVPQYAEQDDPRVTKTGRILRKLRIDELPQLINVLLGEMSFVGPRPERPEFVQQYLTTIPYYGLRHTIKPGITGWAQISYPYGSTEQDTLEKLQYDLYYLKNYDLLLDLNILFQTVHTVLWGRGAR